MKWELCFDPIFGQVKKTPVRMKNEVLKTVEESGLSFS